MRLELSVALVALFTAGAAVGCGTTRTADAYRNDTAAALQTRSSSIKSCYDSELETNADAAGTVVVNFTVEAKSGKLVDPVVDPSSTAPASLGQCVVDAIGGVSIEPGDKKTGKGTFTWRFERG